MASRFIESEGLKGRWSRSAAVFARHGNEECAHARATSAKRCRLAAGQRVRHLAVTQYECSLDQGALHIPVCVGLPGLELHAGGKK